MTSVDVVTGELLPVAVRADLLSSAPVTDVVALQRDYLALCEALLSPEDYQRLDGKDFKKKSAWRKLAAAFNVSDRIVERHFDYNDDGAILRAEYVVEATAPNGRQSVGVGLASRMDSRYRTRGITGNPEHDIPATAHTRAKNRAFSDLFGMGEVSAEEIEDDRTTGGGGGKGRRRATKANEPADVPPPLPPVGVEGTAALEDRLRADDDVRVLFRTWRMAQKLPWPPADIDQLAKMNAEVDKIESEVHEDADTYDGP